MAAFMNREYGIGQPCTGLIIQGLRYGLQKPEYAVWRKSLTHIDPFALRRTINTQGPCLQLVPA